LILKAIFATTLTYDKKQRMKDYIQHDAWSIVEEGFHAQHNEITESLLSLGNGRMGGRGNFEEQFTGKTLQGNYVAGVWFPDKTRVGWWKNGYPRYFAKVINACNWVGIDVTIDNEAVDLNTCEVLSFRRQLNMRFGYLQRNCVVRLKSGKELSINSLRFCSITDDQSGAIRYEVTPLNFDGQINITPYLDGDISNKDTNYGEKFWDEIARESGVGEGYLHLKTSENKFGVERFDVVTAMKITVKSGEKQLSDFEVNTVSNSKYVASQITVEAHANQPITVWKYAVNLSSNNYPVENLVAEAKTYLETFAQKDVLEDQKQAWLAKWKQNDIVIEGDIAAQQAIRFNIFQLQQTYTGQDSRLNIGPKGFTGEKYGGSTYWDTEAYCLPFYLSTSDQKVARNLLVYRHNHLQKAIENATMLGFKDGAALYPMVTMTGEECHNEWEITFEEIHRNGAIAYAIYDYVNYTGDSDYLAEYGLDVLVGIARFWAQRVNWSADKQKYVMLGVTGPNEYENNSNNNWYTNYLAAWCLRYTLSVVNEQQTPSLEVGGLELEKWQHIIDNMYYPYDEQRQVFLQQDGFLDKELINAANIMDQRPINQKWSWDRILRSCFIKQADVLQGLYFFENEFDIETLRRNFDFYEPMTVHESSLSPCIHVIQAAKLGMPEKAYEMYLRTARLDIDDYNNDTEDGLHITSMAGTWLSVIKGFAGMRVVDNVLTFSPMLPAHWTGYSFNIGFRGGVVNIAVDATGVKVTQVSGETVAVLVK
jgi:maltose phosphorylase